MTLSIIQAISFYSPLIILISILVFSIFSSAVSKGFAYIFWFFVVTAFRMLIVWQSSKNIIQSPVSELCNTGSFLPYTNLTYSTYILSFTLFYFITPMIMLSNGSSNMINYFLIIFFVAYIIADLFIKRSSGCLSAVNPMSLFAELLGGCGSGALVSGLVYGSPMKSSLFINEINSSKEICTMPTKQQFKCAVYKNGEVIGSTIS
jgi:hypothetical protein